MTGPPNARPPLASADARVLARLLVDTSDSSALARQTAMLQREFPGLAWGSYFEEALVGRHRA